MKKLLLYLSTLMLALGLAACGSDDNSSNAPEKETAEDTDNEQANESLEKPDEVKAYVEETRLAYLELAELGVSWDELRNASANGEITDYDFGLTIFEEIIPANADLVEKVEAIIAPTDETIETSELLISAVNKQQQAFTEVLSAIDTGDASKITSANSILTEVRTIDRDFARKMEALVTKYGIE